ncbi:MULTISPECIES: tRNA pseudouridine(38-40) synthase TruA [Oleiagrimonas]|jgi:tRNA pseudouridine38-40 synthase|uniref:tRNA pseudouridine synthase A n=1 Tax=Oleiagrimonas citrea TaxID=1665687 RepID=A0A846ZMP5_9GAMM|nr:MULTISPECIES: tRNA pseudouridine(38-40) synthase TruA [Oleiagrimonas]NKZ38840.1 tRNA pseudouridine(38-40) synthase TruA [Oleiagrimonas citrea]RAP59177.1 tRNA pseudouridine(38-40) synthase TruA [Oleiagrimonas sp. MCCC 1A03011]
MRIALGIEYDGTDFMGWQRLSHGPTVQSAVEKAVSTVADTPLDVTCAGRTDAGVHARCQVVHMDTEVQRSMRGWALGGCANLPRSVAVLWAQPVADDFHARHSARARRYRYSILNRPVRAALEARYVTWERHPLDAEAMHAAAQALVGEHDFSAFRAIACQARHARREVREVRVWRDGEHVHVEIEANAFLYHMVRNIVGSLLPIGRHERPEAWMAELLAGRDRDVAGPTAPASGLTFIGPRYPADWMLPEEVTL